MFVYSQIGEFDLVALKQEAAISPKRRARYNLHRSRVDPVQEMIIAACSDTILFPHRQVGRRKSYVIIEGIIEIKFYSPIGAEMTTYLLDENKCLILSFDATQWHTVAPISDSVIFKETISGPYDPHQTEWATWINVIKDFDLFSKTPLNGDNL